MLGCVLLFAAPWTAARQAPLPVGFSRQEHWSGLPFPSPGHLPDPGITLASPALTGGFFTTEPLGKPQSRSVLDLIASFSPRLLASTFPFLAPPEGLPVIVLTLSC